MHESIRKKLLVILSNEIKILLAPIWCMDLYLFQFHSRLTLPKVIMKYLHEYYECHVISSKYHFSFSYCLSSYNNKIEVFMGVCIVITLIRC